MLLTKTECVHEFITTDTEDVCRKCGYVSPHPKYDSPAMVDFCYNFDWTTRLDAPHRRVQQQVNEKFVPYKLRRACNLLWLFNKELGIKHPVLELDTINLYKRPCNTKLGRGLNLAITIAACIYISAQRLNVIITLAQLADIIIKHNLMPKRMYHRTDMRRYVKIIIYRLVQRCMRINHIKQQSADIHPVAVLIAQVGARGQYKTSIIRHGIDIVNALLAKDPTVFAGRKPAGEAATIMWTCKAAAQIQLSRDFKVSAQQIRQNLKRIEDLINKYDIRRAPLSRVCRSNTLD